MLGTADTGGGKIRRPRWSPSDDAKALLETIFTADSFPTFSVRSQLAEQLGIDARQVQIWFQNRRQRERLKTGAGKDALGEGDSPQLSAPGEHFGGTSPAEGGGVLREGASS